MIITYPYAVASDLHCHNWSAYAQSDATGVNGRLQIILSELKRVAAVLLARGGNHLFLAGDLFHVRGQIDPEVLNPVYDTMAVITRQGVVVHAIPGNHDLKGRQTTEIGNALQSLGYLHNFYVYTSFSVPVTGVAMVPWIEDLNELRSVVSGAVSDSVNQDLIIHAPLQQTLSSTFDFGLHPSEVASWGYKRVFAGHFHNHKSFDDRVYSIGAIAHHTWSDVGSRAGFLLVWPDRVEFIESQAPKFVELDLTSNFDDAAGNYVRLKTNLDQVVRKRLIDKHGAREVIFSERKIDKTTQRTDGVVITDSQEQNIVNYIKSKYNDEIADDLIRVCLDIFSQVSKG